MKITTRWLDTHTWMIRSSNNGVSYKGYRWPAIGKWIDCKDWTTEPKCGGGLHGETKNYHGFGMMWGRIDLVEYEGEAIPLDDNNVKVR